MKKLFIIFFPIFILAQSIKLDIGSSKDDIDKNFLSISFSKNTPIKKLPTYTSIYVGGWESPQSANFIFLNEGIEYKDRFFISAEIGAGFINHTTKNLSTNFEFNERVSVGYSFKNFDISINYIHISNGGIKEPNRGENFITMQVSYPLNP